MSTNCKLMKKIKQSIVIVRKFLNAMPLSISWRHWLLLLCPPVRQLCIKLCFIYSFNTVAEPLLWQWIERLIPRIVCMMQMNGSATSIISFKICHLIISCWIDFGQSVYEYCVMIKVAVIILEVAISFNVLLKIAESLSNWKLIFVQCNSI